MKKILMFAVFSFSLFAAAQMKEWKVVYERTIQMQVRNANAGMANNMPGEGKDKFELLFANNNLYSNLAWHERS